MVLFIGINRFCSNDTIFIFSIIFTGNCYPCPLTVDMSCFCKSTTITVPCGREKVTKPPRCNKKCQ